MALLYIYQVSNRLKKYNNIIELKLCIFCVVYDIDVIVQLFNIITFYAFGVVWVTNLVTSRLTKNVTSRNLLKSLDKILSITSISCNFTNLYKVFFLNDFIDLKVFFRKWHKVGIGIAIYRGRD